MSMNSPGHSDIVGGGTDYSDPDCGFGYHIYGRCTRGEQEHCKPGHQGSRALHRITSDLKYNTDFLLIPINEGETGFFIVFFDHGFLVDIHCLLIW